MVQKFWYSARSYFLNKGPQENLQLEKLIIQTYRHLPVCSFRSACQAPTWLRRAGRCAAPSGGSSRWPRAASRRPTTLGPVRPPSNRSLPETQESEQKNVILDSFVNELFGLLLTN
jgi:hypothetical protein